jgi:hypothetical protein
VTSCACAGLPITWALAHRKLDERQVLMADLDQDRHLLTERPEQLLIADKGYTSAELDAYLHARGADLLRPGLPQPRAPPRAGDAQTDPPTLSHTKHDGVAGHQDVLLPNEAFKIANGHGPVNSRGSPLPGAPFRAEMVCGRPLTSSSLGLGDR